MRPFLFAAILLTGCSMRAPKPAAAAKPAPPKPVVVNPAAVEPDAPYSVVQTVATLPKHQDIPPGADAIAPPPPPPPEPEPERTRPATRTAPAAQPPAQTATPEPARPRIRILESADERRRVQADVDTRRREAEAILAQVRKRSLSAAQKDSVDRCQAFLDQAAAALRRNDLQEADALSSRAVMLSRDLPRE